jgi:hypothetical protein
MADLADYSGPLDAGLKYDYFSKELLLKGLKAYGDYIRVLDGTWYLAVKRKMGDDLAFDCDRLVWDRMEVHDVEITRKLFNIKGDDVAALLKCLLDEPLDLESGAPRPSERAEPRRLDGESLSNLVGAGERGRRKREEDMRPDRDGVAANQSACHQSEDESHSPQTPSADEQG